MSDEWDFVLGQSVKLASAGRFDEALAILERAREDAVRAGDGRSAAV